MKFTSPAPCYSENNVIIYTEDIKPTCKEFSSAVRIGWFDYYKSIGFQFGDYCEHIIENSYAEQIFWQAECFGLLAEENEFYIFTTKEACIAQIQDGFERHRINKLKLDNFLIANVKAKKEEIGMSDNLYKFLQITYNPNIKVFPWGIKKVLIGVNLEGYFHWVCETEDNKFIYIIDNGKYVWDFFYTNPIDYSFIPVWADKYAITNELYLFGKLIGFDKPTELKRIVYDYCKNHTIYHKDYLLIYDIIKIV